MNALLKSHLLLRGDFDPDEISRELDLEPSIITRAGELNPATGTTRDAGSWLLTAAEFPTFEAGDVADQVIALLGQLEGKQQVFATLAKRYMGSMTVYALTDGEKPSFFLGDGLMLEIGKLNVDFECWFVRNKDLAQSAAVSA